MAEEKHTIGELTERLFRWSDKQSALDDGVIMPDWQPRPGEQPLNCDGGTTDD